MSFWSDVFPPAAELGYYYTYPSFYLFLIALVMPESRLRWILLLNSILVGALGNAIYLVYYERHAGDLRELFPGLTQEQAARSSFRTNLAHHTLPMAVSLLLLLRAPRLDPADLPRYLGVVAAMWLLWLAVPYDGRDGGRKVKISYASPLIGVSLVWALYALLYLGISSLQ